MAVMKTERRGGVEKGVMNVIQREGRKKGAWSKGMIQYDKKVGKTKGGM